MISERHPLFAGIYEGAMGREEVTQFVEKSDCVLLLGAFMTDINLGIYTANLDPARCIYATSETLRISHHHLRRRAAGRLHRRADRRRSEGAAAAAAAAGRRRATSRSSCGPTSRSPSRRLIARLNQSLDDSMVVIADIRATPCSPPATW